MCKTCKKSICDCYHCSKCGFLSCLCAMNYGVFATPSTCNECNRDKIGNCTCNKVQRTTKCYTCGLTLEKCNCLHKYNPQTYLPSTFPIGDSYTTAATTFTFGEQSMKESITKLTLMVTLFEKPLEKHTKEELIRKFKIWAIAYRLPIGMWEKQLKEILGWLT